jgi:hypothetical protein
MVLLVLLVSVTWDTWLEPWLVSLWVRWPWRTERWKGFDGFTGFSYIGHLAGALAGLMVGLVTLENRKMWKGCDGFTISVTWDTWLEPWLVLLWVWWHWRTER